MDRACHGSYQDPLDLIWIRCVERLGMRLERTDEVYASWDGQGALSVASPAHFDPDDSLAQLILHELCHGLVQGPAGRSRTDWGLDNTDEAGCTVAEHACHRLQAALADRYGLRDLFAVTTHWRSYWEALPEDPLAAGDDPAIPLARRAWADAVRGAWSRPLQEALAATADLADLVRPLAPVGSLWARTRGRTPIGLAAKGSDHCGSCAWAAGSPLHCRFVEEVGEVGPPVQASQQACIAWEPRLDAAACRACAACCREGFHVVTVEPDEPLVTARPCWLVQKGDALVLPRPGGRCVALEGTTGCWSCTTYALRPRACNDFEAGGEHCLTARRRVGLTRS